MSTRKSMISLRCLLEEEREKGKIQDWQGSLLGARRAVADSFSHFCG